MSAVPYVPAHHRHRLLTEAQVRSFIDALDRAAAGDVEKAVEQAVNTLITQGLSSIYQVPVVSTYAYNTDGYIAAQDPGNPYALLVEAKNNMQFSAPGKRDIATVLTQVCWYLRAIGNAGDTVPTVSVVCDNDEIFAIPTTLLKPHIGGDYRWDELSASSMHKDANLLAALIQDPNIRPYVHDVSENFDAIMFIWAVDAMGCGEDPVRVPVNSKSMEWVFTRFKMEVLGTDATGLKNKDEIALFIDILRGSDDIYAHPKKPNTLVWGKKTITLDTYRFERFWAQYVTGDYTLDQVKSLTEMGDVLIEETDRRFSGDYWTPPIWVDKSHEYIEDALGDNWRDKYVVWDSSWGSGNLTRDYKFANLFASTLFQEELDIAVEYNTDATKFQYDFLNDDMVLHEDGMTAAKALELARAGELKMPLPLVEALAANKPIVFYGNPPYGQATSAMGKAHKPGVSATAVTDLMEGMGHAKGELYTQFMWRAKELAKVFEYTSDFHICFFTKAKFLPSPHFQTFNIEFFSEFEYVSGFLMNAGEFSGTSSVWPISFFVASIGSSSHTEMPFDVLVSSPDMTIERSTTWETDPVTKKSTISAWLKEVALSGVKEETYPLTKNGFDSPTAKSIRCIPHQGSVGYIVNIGSNVQKSDNDLQFFTMGAAQANGRDITPDNIERVAVTFSIRRACFELIQARGERWIRNEDIFTRPPEELLTDEFIADCMVYSLFNIKSFQTSLRDYEYKGRTYRVINEFFPFAHADVVKLAQEHTSRTIEADALGEGDRLVRRWLVDHEGDVSEEAAAVLDMAWEIIGASFGKREVFDVVQPRFQVQSWDAGWAQVNAMVFGRDRVDDEVYDEFYVKWRETRRVLGDKIAKQAMDAGVI